MITFLIVALVMIAIAIAWVLVPLLRHRQHAGIGREASNVAILRDQLKELASDYANGTLGQEQYEQSKRELEQRVLVESTPASPHAPPSSSPGGWRTAAAIGAVVPIAALALYAVWGNHDAFNPAAQVAQQEHDVSPEQINGMIEKLATRLKSEPDNVEGWVVLARTYYAVGRYDEAVPAFDRAVSLAPDDPRLLADYADALGATQKSLQGKPTELVEKALKIEPTYWKALALAGTAAFDRKDYKQAVAYWEQLKGVIPPNAPMSKTIDSSIAEARELAGMPAALAGAAAAPSPTGSSAAATPAVAEGAPKAPSNVKLEGMVTLSPALAAKASPTDSVYIFARAAEGSRMPLAIVRREVKDLPARFSLDDSMAMTPQMMLSSFDQVVVGARISKSGTAMPKSGDLEGVSGPVKPGARGVDIVIDRTLP